jgi:hypothetical protein
MNLEKCLLKYIFRRSPVADETHQKVIKLALIARDKIRKTRSVAVAICGKQLLVRTIGQ